MKIFKRVISAFAIAILASGILGYYIYKEIGKNWILKSVIDSTVMGYLNDFAYEIGFKSYPQEPTATVTIHGENEVLLRTFPAPWIIFDGQEYSRIKPTLKGPFPGWSCSWGNAEPSIYGIFSNLPPKHISMFCKFGKHWGGNRNSSNFVQISATFENANSLDLKSLSVRTNYIDSKYKEKNRKKGRGNFVSRNNYDDVTKLNISFHEIILPKSSIDKFSFNFSVNLPRRLNPGQKDEEERYTFKFVGFAVPDYTNFRRKP